MKLMVNFLLFFILTFNCPTHGADVILIDVPSQPSVAQQQLELVCQFYGLTLERFTIDQGQNHPLVLNARKLSEAQAMVITADALSGLEAQKIFSALRRQRKQNIPILIMGLTAMLDEKVLKRWSDGAVTGCLKSTEAPPRGFYRVASAKALTRELSGQDIAFWNGAGYYLNLDTTVNAQWVMAIKKKGVDEFWPVFVRSAFAGNEVFFLATMQHMDSSRAAAWRYDEKRFFEIAPLLLFLRYAGGERCWHRDNDYANFTIDDPWLTEPYGYLSYKGLLAEMEKHNFHTTIAFIPWNFDRTAPEVAAMFRRHPDRFSICLHGNNHDHREFYKYETDLADPVSAKPLSLQEFNIKQALARMEKFRDLTGLAYDKVMIFPHGIAPEKTLGLLRKYNFLATVNLSNIPLDAKEPADPFFHLRAVTLNFENFPSLKRASPNAGSESEIAIDLFLDNPALFYTHQDFFGNGISSFNRVAQAVNKIKPDIVWQSLGNIVQHLYLKKLRADGNYDILSSSGNFILENVQRRDLIYFIRKEETFLTPIRQLTVNGQPCAYTSSENEILFTVSIPAGESRHVIIEYENNLQVEAIDLARPDARINLLRRFSDFRDMILSQNALGQKFIRFYYRTNLYRFGLIPLTILLVAAIIAARGGWVLFRRRKKTPIPDHSNHRVGERS